MFVLDTNVLSEIMEPEGAEEVVIWCDAVQRHELFTTALCQAEILYGIAIKEKGRRRETLTVLADAMFSEDFNGRILPFDDRAAAHFADIAATQRRRGTPVGIIDMQIAGIARSRGMIVVTRNVKDFETCEVEIVNPWSP